MLARLNLSNWCPLQRSLLEHYHLSPVGPFPSAFSLNQFCLSENFRGRQYRPSGVDFTFFFLIDRSRVISFYLGYS